MRLSSKFLPHDAMGLCPCLCLSQVGVLPKRLNLESNKQHYTIAHGFVFWSQKTQRNSTGEMAGASTPNNHDTTLPLLTGVQGYNPRKIFWN